MAETMSDVWNVVDGLKPAIVMVMVQISYVGINIFYKLAINDGMDLRVVIAYRFIFATAFMAPLGLIFERKRMPKMTWTILFQALLCGLFGGVLAQTLYLETLALTSVTFASAMNNLNPLVTFIMSLCFGLERSNLRAAAGKAKIIGTLTGVGGAMLLTFFKGPHINTGSFHVTLLHHHNGHVAPPHSSSGGSTLLGGLCAMGGCLSYSLWLIIQTKMSARYPCPYSSTALMNVVASVFSVAFALCVDRDWSQWRLGRSIRLLTVAYAGLLPAGVTVVAIAWCVLKRGPLFVSVFSPLQLVLLALAGSFMLDEKLNLGCIIGGVLIVCGLYAVLWGKGKEMKKMNDKPPVSPTVEIIIKSPVNNKSINLHNNIKTSNDVRDHEDHSSENGSQVVHDSTNKKEERKRSNI